MQIQLIFGSISDYGFDQDHFVYLRSSYLSPDSIYDVYGILINKTGTFYLINDRQFSGRKDSFLSFHNSVYFNIISKSCSRHWQYIKVDNHALSMFKCSNFFGPHFMIEDDHFYERYYDGDSVAVSRVEEYVRLIMTDV